MRHLKRTAKLGRTGQHRNMMLANLVCSLIMENRVTTTVAKAKAARSVAEKLVTMAKTGSLQARRLCTARLLQQKDPVKRLFREIAPLFQERRGGFTRIIRVNQRRGDAAELAILEWVELPVVAPEPVKAGETKAEAAKTGETAEGQKK